MIYFCVVINLNNFSLIKINDEGVGTLQVLGILSFCSIIGGSLLSWLIFPFPILIVLSFYYKLLTLIVCILGGIFGYFLFRTYKYYIKFNYLKSLVNIFLSLI